MNSVSGDAAKAEKQQAKPIEAIDANKNINLTTIDETYK